MSYKKSKNKTKGYISLALYRLMLSKDYEEITVKEICERAGVSRMSFYRYYNMKDDIFIDYCDERFEEFYNSVKDLKTVDAREFVLSMFKFIKKYSRQLKILKMAHREFMLLDQLNSYTKYVVSNLKTDYLQGRKNNPLFPYFISGGLFNVILYWISTDIKMTAEEATNMLFDIVNL